MGESQTISCSCRRGHALYTNQRECHSKGTNANLVHSCLSPALQTVQLNAAHPRPIGSRSIINCKSTLLCTSTHHKSLDYYSIPSPRDTLSQFTRGFKCRPRCHRLPRLELRGRVTTLLPVGEAPNPPTPGGPGGLDGARINIMHLCQDICTFADVYQPHIVLCICFRLP